MIVNRRTYLTAVGLGLFLVGVLGLVFLRARPSVVRSTGLVHYAHSECRANLNLTRGGRIIAVGEIRAIPFQITPRQEARTKPCEYWVSISTMCAVGTASDQKRTLTLERGMKRIAGELFMQCNEAGQQLVTIMFDLAGPTGSQRMIYDIRHLGWFTTVQATALSWIASFLGPALTLPFWFEIYGKWKARREAEAAET